MSAALGSRCWLRARKKHPGLRYRRVIALLSKSGKNLGGSVFNRMHRHSLAAEVQDKAQVLGMRAGTDMGKEGIIGLIGMGRHVLHRTMHINDEA